MQEFIATILATVMMFGSSCQTEIKDTLTVDETVEQTYEIYINEEDVTYLAKTAWGEARGCSDTEVAAVMWCILNRVDAEGYARGNSVKYVVTFPNQFTGYSSRHPVEERFTTLAEDVLTRWQMEKQGAPADEVGRVLPREYEYFHGDGRVNRFRIGYKHDGHYWDWSLPSPYETES